MLTEKKLKEIVFYNISTGEFFWIEKSGGRSKHSKAGTLGKKYGYVTIQINKKLYRAHRLAWLYVYGSFPKRQIDHINGIRHDNRIENLRDVSPRENSMNRKEHRNGRLVGAVKMDKKWQARLKIGDKIKILGRFATELEAHEVYKAKLKELGL